MKMLTISIVWETTVSIINKIRKLEKLNQQKLNADYNETNAEITLMHDICEIKDKCIHSLNIHKNEISWYSTARTQNKTNIKYRTDIIAMSRTVNYIWKINEEMNFYQEI